MGQRQFCNPILGAQAAFLRRRRLLRWQRQATRRSLHIYIADPLSPPNLEAKNVQSVQNSLARFFSQAREQLGVQVKTLNGVGAPPNGRASTEWKQAVGGMETVRTQLGVVQRNVKVAKLKDQKALEKFTADLGDQMQALSNYPGPVAILSPNPEIGPAIQAEPRCKKLS